MNSASYDNLPLVLSRLRITQPPRALYLEHHVASFITTMAIQVFQEVKDDRGRNQWIFTPEQRDEDSGRRPDFTVERIERTDKDVGIKGWLCMEFKKHGGLPHYKALRQLVETIEAKVYNEYCPTIYLVVAVGTQISFWEKEIDWQKHSISPPDTGVPYLWGCRSLMQSRVGSKSNQKEPPYTTGRGTIPEHVDVLLQPGNVRDPNTESTEAEGYTIPAILDLTIPEHGVAAIHLFQYMAKYAPREF